MGKQSKKKKNVSADSPPGATPAGPVKAASKGSIQAPTKQFRNSQRWLLAAFLFAVVLGVFWPCLDNDFINCDDDLYVSANPHVQQGFTAEAIAWSFTTFEATNWHPLTWLSHILAYDLFGLKPAGHHFINILLHAVNAALLFLVLELMTGAKWKSLAVAALFALHPLRVESVAWVAERKDVLCAMFWFLTIWAYVRYARALRDGGRVRLFYGLMLGCFVFALLSKPMVVTLPFVLLLLDYWPLRRSAERGVRSAESEARPSTTKRLIWEKVPLLALSVVSCVVTYMAQKSGGAVGSKVPLLNRVETALLGYFRYPGKMFWPTHLAMQYPYPHHWPAVAVGCAAIGLMVITALAFIYARKLPWLTVGWFWYLGTLVPVIGLIQVGLQSLADRYTYIPGIGIAVIVVWGLSALWQSWRLPANVLAVPALAAVCACVVVTRRQIDYWQNSGTIFAHSAEVTTDNYSANEYLGNYEFKAGNPKAAMAAYLETVRVDPKNEAAITGIAYILFFNAGQRDAGIEELEKGVQLKPDSATLQNNLGMFYKEQGRYADAEPHLREALRLKPTYAEADVGLAYICLKDGRRDEAITLLKHAIQVRPDLKVAEKMLRQATTGAPQ